MAARPVSSVSNSPSAYVSKVPLHIRLRLQRITGRDASHANPSILQGNVVGMCPHCPCPVCRTSRCTEHEGSLNECRGTERRGMIKAVKGKREKEREREKEKEGGREEKISLLRQSEHRWSVRRAIEACMSKTLARYSHSIRA